MDQAVYRPFETPPQPKDVKEAWASVTNQLQAEMVKGLYLTWVAPLVPVRYKDGVFLLGAHNRVGLAWVESHLESRIRGLLSTTYFRPVTVKIKLLTNLDEEDDDPVTGDAPELKAAAPELGPTPLLDEKSANGRAAGSRKKPAPVEDDFNEGGNPRKIQLQRAYGTERASIIQPERIMIMTNYFFDRWLPLLGHSALAVVMAARRMCYWNPKSGELRNVVETEMSLLAERANVSVRTVKDVLNTPLVKQYFLRYKVRRVMTSNGVRTAGILMQVRMDDPLTPEDQDTHNLVESEAWYTAEFDGEVE